MTTNIKYAFFDRILKNSFLKVVPTRVSPNSLTVLRMAMIPLVVYLLFTERYLPGIIFFLMAAFTDALDGALARTRDKITDWGKFWDPVADKLLIISCAAVVVPRYINNWLFVLIIASELGVLIFLYLITGKQIKNISANVWGKIKMILQSVGLGVLLLNTLLNFAFLVEVSSFLLWTGIFFAIISAYFHAREFNKQHEASR